MKILLVRHAAASKATPSVVDADRSLSRSGREKFGVAARGLARIVGQVDVLLTSPLTRARETAEIVAQALTLEPVVELALAGERIDAIVAALASHPPEATVVLVGHEPMLAAVVARMLGSAEAKPFTFRRGGAALLALPNGPGATGRLVWFMPPRVLRALAGVADIMAASRVGNGQAAVARERPS